MRKPWILFPLLAAVIFAAAAGLDFYRHRFVRSDRDLFRFLPQQNTTLFYANVDALRRAGVLPWFAGTATARDADYGKFIRETHFDYTKDLDAIAGSADAKRLFLLVRGRFDGALIRAYAEHHGGTCRNSVCRIPSSTPGRWTSLAPIQPDVLALATAPSRFAIETLRTRRDLVLPLPGQPLWIKLPHNSLQNPPDLPVGLRLFALSLSPADSVVFSLSAAGSHASAQFQLALDAQCASAPSAAAMRNQLEIETKLLKLALARRHVQPSPADLTGLLTAGSFRISGTRVIGDWPLHRELLNNLR